MSEERFDAIVVGAGPAGCTVAYLLAKAGKSVLVIERGTSAGGKNVTGGRLYTYALELVEPGLTAQAPLERAVMHEQIMMLDGERSINIEYSDPSLVAGTTAPLSHTVLHAPFNEWYAGLAESVGAVVACGVRVDDLIERDGRIAGVVAGGDEMLADVVVAADGVNSFMAQKAGLRQDISPHQVGVCVKELIELPRSVIESRFHLTGNQGAARLMLGGTGGVNGGGFLYTNLESISLGCVLLIEPLANSHRSIHDLFQELKMHPAIYSLIEGGTSVEYAGHLVPEAGWNGVPKQLFRDGILAVGDAAGMAINHGYTVRGIDLAIVSGIAAARAIVSTNAAKDVGPAYVQQLEKLGLVGDMKRMARFPSIMDNPRLFSTYPAMAADALGSLFCIQDLQSISVAKTLWGSVRKHTSVGTLLKDGWQTLRAIK